ncbi:MAG: hypothetical protein PHT30_05615 [Bacilli bacterium]|nr:hypothetical protein [Bacilli bacterium]
MNQQAQQNRFKTYYSIVINYREHTLKNGVNYGNKQAEAEKKLASWILAKCPGATYCEIEELIGDVVQAKEDEIMCLLADLEAISVDTSKLPRMKGIAKPEQINIDDILADLH